MDSPSVEALLKACRLGDTSQMKALLDAEPLLINHIDSSLGWAPLFRSVICGHEEATRFLLERGADPNIRNKMGETPLHQASDNSKTSIAQLLLQFNADPNLAQNDGDTPLHQAAYKGNAGIAELLLQHHVDPNAANTVFGRTPLHYAADYNKLEVAQVLLKYGAGASPVDNAGHRPVDLAQSEDMRALLMDVKQTLPVWNTRANSVIEPDAERTFIEAPKPISLNNEKQSILYSWLVSYKLEEVFEQLVEAGYDDLDQMTKQMNSSLPLSEEIIENIGVKCVGQRKRLLAALAEEAKPMKSSKGSGRKESGGGLFKCCVTPTPSNLDFTNLPSLSRWLEAIKLQEYTESFIQAGLDEVEPMLALMHTPWKIDEAALGEIGVHKPGHVHRILAKLNEDCNLVEGFKRNVGSFSTKRRREEPGSTDTCCIM